MLQEEVHYTQELIRKHLRKMHTAVPGKVTKYYPEKGMCDIQPVMQFKKPNGEWIDYPELKDVPVWWPQSYGQTSTIVYPIKKDDEVLVLLIERPIDYWLFGMQTEQDLMFDLSEAICIPGLFAKPNELAKTAQEEEAIIIQRQDTFIKIKEDDVIIDTQRDTVINVLRNVTVNAESDVTVNSGKDTVVNAEKDATVNADNNVTVNANKDISLNAAETIELNADQVKINGQDLFVEAATDFEGDLSVTGDATVGGKVEASEDVVADGISLKEHTHEDSVGGTTTAPFD